jgi:hypothetical protein
MQIAPTDPTRKRTFVLTLVTDADGAVRRLRNLLKTALRRDRLKCIAAVEQKTKPSTHKETSHE